MRGIDRRTVLIGITATLGACATATPATPQPSDNPADWIGRTPHINSDHPQVRAKAAALTNGRGTDRQKARAIFEFVRDEVKFGFTRGFWDNTASDVLASRTGYCNTKSTLFVALLRAVDIPARQVFVDIDRSVLHGILDPGTPYVDHSYVEVLLDGAWIATDAYIVDKALFTPAQARAESEGRLLG